MAFLDEINSMSRPDTAMECDFRNHIERTVKRIQENILWGKPAKREISGHLFHYRSLFYFAPILTDGTYKGSPVLDECGYDNEDLNPHPQKYLKIEDAQYDINGFRRILTELGFQNFTLRIDKIWLSSTLPRYYPWYDRRYWTEAPRKPQARYLIYMHLTW